MIWLRVLVLSAVLLATFLPGRAGVTYACSCAGNSAAGYVDEADTVVVGTVTRAFGMIDINVAVAAESYLKGTGPPVIRVDDPKNGGVCGFLGRRSLGERYVFFLQGETSPFWTSLCGGNSEVGTEAGQVFLNKVQTVTGVGSVPVAGHGRPWLPIAVGDALGAVVLSAAFVFWRLLRAYRRGPDAERGDAP